jgi:serine/threonine-protein kinase
LTEQSLAGRQFGPYEVLEELGSGGMGKVYRAKNVMLERIVALKTLTPLLSADEGFVQRFLKEARVAARLNHPNIVQIYDFGCVEGIHYLAMEYVDGLSLRALLKRGRFSERDAIQVVRQAVRALGVAHALGIVHRDVKPDNLMLTSRGELKLVDLGIAKRVDEEGQGLTQTGQAVGTPHYISPEQIRGLKDIDARSDIYSLGATFYHLVTGQAPYKGTSGALVMSMHLTAPLPDPRQFEPSLSEGLCRVLRKAMAKDPAERYADVGALDRDLQRLQTGQAPEADEPTITGIATMIGPDRQGTTQDMRAPSLPGSQTPAGGASGSRARYASEWFRGKAGTPAPGTGAPRTGGTGAPPAPPPASTTLPAPTTAPPVPPAPAFREEDLHFVEVELARQIGPLARVLVKKAAKTAPNLVALAAALAENIPDEEGRRNFRSAVRARAK